MIILALNCFYNYTLYIHTQTYIVYDILILDLNNIKVMTFILQ